MKHFNFLSNWLKATNTPPCKHKGSSRILVLILILLTLGVGNAWGGNKTYSRITSTSDLTSGGKYLIVCESKNDILKGSTVSDGSEIQSVTISSNSITCDETYAFTITGSTGAWTIKGSNNKVIGHTGSKNTLNTGTYTNTITFSGDNVSIGCNSRTLKHNSTSSMFRYYGSGQTAIQLYKEVSSTKTLSSIAVSTAPTKTTYTEGEYFAPAGLVITRTYSDATSDTYTYANHTSEFSFTPSTSTALTTSNTSVTITYGGKSTSQAITVNAAGGGGGSGDDVTDVLTASDLAATGTTYVNFSNVTKTSDAIYAGNSALNNSTNIQLRSSNSNSGIVSTKSGGTVKSVKITVASGSNTVDVYGSNTAYTAASDLYGNNKGTKIGSVSSTGTITFTSDYAYVGIRSYSGAVYLSSVEITWEESAESECTKTPTVSFATASPEAITAGDTYTNLASVQYNSSATGQTITYASSDPTIASVDASTGEVTANKAGSVTITATAAESGDYCEASETYSLTINAAPDSKTTKTINLTVDETSVKTEDEIAWAGTYVSVSAVKGTTAANNYCPPSQNSTRFYTNSTLTITPVTGYKIDNIVFTAMSDNYATILANSTWTNAVATVGTGDNSKKVTVTASGLGAVSAAIGNTCGFSQIVINYHELTSYAVTVTNPAHGTITVKDGDSNIGATVLEGKTLTVSGESNNPAYAFGTISAYKTGEPGTTVTITNGQLTMPDYPITITADETALLAVNLAIVAKDKDDNVQEGAQGNAATIDDGTATVYKASGETVALAATPYAGYYLVGWTATSGITIAGSTATITAAGTITATFKKNPCSTLGTPANVAVSGTSYPFNAVALDWDDVANADHYVVTIKKGEEAVKNVTVNASAYTLDVTLLANTTYTYYIQATADDEDTYCASAIASANFATGAYPSVTLYYSENGTLSAGESKNILTDFILADPETDPCEKKFVGWSTVTVAETNIAPAMMQPGDTYQIPTNANCTLYAVYANVTPGSDVYLLTPAASVSEGTYIIAGYSTNYKALNGDVSTGSNNDLKNEETGFSIDGDGYIETLPADACEFTFTAVTGGFTIQKPNGDYLGYSSTTSNRKLAFGDYSSKVWNATAHAKAGYPDDGLYLATSEYKIFTNGSGATVCRGYQISADNYNPMYLFKKTKGADVISGGYATTCAAAPTATPDPVALDDVDATGENGTIAIAYTNVNASGVTVGLFNDAACTEAFGGNWLTVSLDGSKNIDYTIAANTSYNDARSAYIKLTAPAEVSGPAAAVVIIPVSQVKKPAVFASLAELAAADLTSGTEVTVTINNRITGIYTNYYDYRYGIYLNQQKYNQEETPVLKDIEIYFKGEQVPASEPEWVIGGTVSGTITCPWEYFTTDEIWELKPGEGWHWTNLTYTAPASVTEVSISGTPSKTTYNVGEAFEPAGLTVHVEYSDDTDADITASDDDWAYVTWNFDPATFAAEHIGTGKSVSATATFSGVISTPATEISGLTVNKVAVTGVSLNQNAATLKAGKTVTLTATIEPANATYKGIEWSTSDGSVATVDNGVVTAVAAGSATITATSTDDNTKTATCAITVTESIDFAAGDWTLVKDAAELTAGSYVIIAAADFDKAMKSYVSGNNCSAEDATKSGDMLEYDEDFGIFEIGDYVISDITYKTFQDAETDQYLYISSNNNHLKAQDTKNADAAWTITSVSNAGVAVVTSKSQSSRTMRYNDNSDLFACYATGQADIALYKYYAPVPKVTYNKNTEDEVTNMPNPSVQRAENNKATIAAGPSRTNYNFAGWNSDAEGNGDAYTVGQEYTFTEDITLYAQWDVLPTYSVTYNTTGSQGTTPVDENTYIEGAEVTLASASGLSNAGFFFDKWVATYVDGNSDTQTLDIEDNKFTMPAFDVTVTATWARKSSDKWIKVTDVSQLVDEKEYIIVNTDATYAIGEQKSNNRAGAAIEENDGIVTISDAVAIFKLGIPETDKYTFYQNGSVADVDKGYLYAASSGSNYMRTQATNDDNGVWTIDINLEGEATITATGEFTRNIMRYNPNNGSPVFSCYASSSSVQNPVTLYYKAPKIDINDGQTVNVSDAEGSDIVIHNGGTLNVDDAKSVGDLTVEAGGKVVVDEDKLTVVGTFSIETTMASGKSGQLSGVTSTNFEAQQEAYIDITLGAGGTNQQWHAFTVPFPVDALNGIYDLAGNKLVNETNYAIMEYHGDVRATGAYGWKKIRTTLVPGTFYIMATDGYRTTYRFKKKAGEALVATNSKAYYEYASSTGNNDNGWNGIGNPNLFYGKVNLAVQVLDPSSYTYVTKTANSTNFVVGTPFFYQAATDGSMVMATANASANYAPARVQTTEIKDLPVGFGNEDFTDYLYVSANEDALSTYETGKDLAKMTMTNTPKVAQIFGLAYNTKLCMVNTPLVNNQAEVALELYAPKTGVYTISVPTTREDASLYLTKDGAIIWDLTMSPFEAELSQGQNSGYGLLLQARAPQIATGVEDVQGDKVQCTKVVINDNVFILRGEQLYDVTGKMVK